MFNLAIDSKLRGCDVVGIKVEDVAPRGYAVDRAMVRQKKTGHPVKFELTEHTRQAIDDYLNSAHKQPGEYLFAGRRGSRTPLNEPEPRHERYPSGIALFMDPGQGGARATQRQGSHDRSLPPLTRP